MTLDEAWAAAEAALPDGWNNGPTLFGYDLADGGRCYTATADAPKPYRRAHRKMLLGEGPSPVAALLALAEKLAAR